MSGYQLDMSSGLGIGPFLLSALGPHLVQIKKVICISNTFTYNKILLNDSGILVAVNRIYCEQSFFLILIQAEAR